MGSIPIPEVKRRTRDVAPQIQTRLPESLATPFRQDVPRAARAIGQLGKAAEGVAVDIVQRVEKHKEAKREERIGTEYLSTYQQGEQLYQELKAKTDYGDEDLVNTLNEGLERFVGEAEVRLGGDKESIDRMRRRLVQDQRAWSKGLATKTVVDREVAAATYESNILDKNRLAIVNDPTPDRLDFGIAQMEFTIDEAGRGNEAERNKRKKLARQTLVQEYLSSIGPEQALAELDDRRLGYSALFLNAEEKESFRRVLKTKANVQKKQAEDAKAAALDKLTADTLGALLKGEQVDPAEVYTNPAVRNDPKALQTFQRMFKNFGKDTKQETKDDQYLETSTWLRLHDTPASVTNAEIIERVDDPKDQEHFIKVRDQYKKATLTDVDYKDTLRSMSDDFDANKFGKGEEGRMEYANQLRTFERYMLETPDADPRAYYDSLMSSKNADYFDNWFSDEAVKPQDLAIAREVEEAVLDTPQEKRAAKRAYLEKAKRLNPDYTVQELSDHYDRNVAGK
jgi:hypothetical protein